MFYRIRNIGHKGKMKNIINILDVFKSKFPYIFFPELKIRMSDVTITDINTYCFPALFKHASTIWGAINPETPVTSAFIFDLFKLYH